MAIPIQYKTGGGVAGHGLLPHTPEPGWQSNYGAAIGYTQVDGVDCSVGAVLFQKTGRIAIHSMDALVTIEEQNPDFYVRLKIDGTTIIDQNFTYTGNFGVAGLVTAAFKLWGSSDYNSGLRSSLCPLICEQSMELYLSAPASVSAGFRGIIVPIP